ncbi:MAG: DNA repair protein RecN, partial [Clostridia bacterium]|nr:DNA repair protein RecN [Clostridia bacterium]
MLRELHIKNIAVIEDITISFGDGFHALTGETGAGKSILIDSINMALGGRTAKDLIRTGADSATVDVVFELSARVEKVLADAGIESEEGLLYISRQITSDGKSKCRLNGRLVPLAVLKEAAETLITIHGQHDNQTILSPKSHIHFVDDYGNYKPLLEEYQAQYHKVQGLKQRLDSLLTDESEKARRIELLGYQINEIDSATIRPGEEAELEERRGYLANIEQIVEKSGMAYESLYGDEDRSAYDAIAAAVHALESVHSYDQRLEEYYNTLSSVLADLEDVTHELKSYLDGVDYQQGELDLLEERLQMLFQLKRKYGGSEEEILAYLAEIKQELSEIEDSDARREAVSAELEKETEALSVLAAALSEKRRETAIELQTAIMQELSDLDMQKMRFSVSVEPLDEAYTPLGSDRVEFLISGNPGEALKPLAKIASGGEMSRIMLAMKSILAGSDMVETLIFDEIDTGVSGRAAQKIAEKICMLAKDRQILCITHLAQIA